ncbi:MAG: hypothetical protein DRO11_04175 [Methanobacteriota archaeon]|nr:MAG: hypothetical protein DRO11_04175 [Euryarchaeota archaeon]
MTTPRNRIRVDETELLKILYNHNPWWTTGKVPREKAPAFKRRDYYKILETLNDHKIVAMVEPEELEKQL